MKHEHERGREHTIQTDMFKNSILLLLLPTMIHVQSSFDDFHFWPIHTHREKETHTHNIHSVPKSSFVISYYISSLKEPTCKKKQQISVQNILHN